MSRTGFGAPVFLPSSATELLCLFQICSSASLANPENATTQAVMSQQIFRIGSHLAVLGENRRTLTPREALNMPTDAKSQIHVDQWVGSHLLSRTHQWSAQRRIKSLACLDAGTMIPRKLNGGLTCISFIRSSSATASIILFGVARIARASDWGENSA